MDYTDRAAMRQMIHVAPIVRDTTIGARRATWHVRRRMIPKSRNRFSDKIMLKQRMSGEADSAKLHQPL
jgi:hypothetical protein